MSVHFIKLYYLCDCSYHIKVMKSCHSFTLYSLCLYLFLYTSLGCTQLFRPQSSQEDYLCTNSESINNTSYWGCAYRQYVQFCTSYTSYVMPPGSPFFLNSYHIYCYLLTLVAFSILAFSSHFLHSQSIILQIAVPLSP